MRKKIITIEYETNIADSKTFIRRLIKIDNKEIFDNTCSITLYSKEISPLNHLQTGLTIIFQRNRLRALRILLPNDTIFSALSRRFGSSCLERVSNSNHRFSIFAFKISS